MLVYKGIKPDQDYSCLPLVSEYLQRTRLAKLGYTSPIEKLSAWKAQAFVLIEQEFEKRAKEESDLRSLKR